jgi:hypothetical protein
VSDPYFERPDLAPLRATASQAESAEVFRGLLSADGYPLAEGEPPAMLARDVAPSLIEAGFSLHPTRESLRAEIPAADKHHIQEDER